MIFQPFPFGWMFWIGSLQIFSREKLTYGLIFSLLLLIGWLANLEEEANGLEYASKVTPWTELEEEIKKLEHKIRTLESDLQLIAGQVNKSGIQP